MKDKVFEYTLLLGVRETIAGFINDHVIPEDGEFHFYPRASSPFQTRTNTCMSFEWADKHYVISNRRQHT